MPEHQQFGVLGHPLPRQHHQTAEQAAYKQVERAQSVVDDEDESELLRRIPSARVAHVEEVGHGVQGDAPVELAQLIGQFIS